MKKFILSIVCAMSAVVVFAVQMPRQYYRPANPSGVVFTTACPTQKGEYRLNGQIENKHNHLSTTDDHYEFNPNTRFVTNRMGQIEEQVLIAYLPLEVLNGDAAMGAMSMAVVSADSLIAEIGATTRNEDGTYAPGAASPIRRAVDAGTGEGTPDEVWTYNGVEYGRDTNGTFYIKIGGIWRPFPLANPGDVGYSYSPIGSPVLPFLLFAMMACGVIYYRRRKVAIA